MRTRQNRCVRGAVNTWWKPTGHQQIPKAQLCWQIISSMCSTHRTQGLWSIQTSPTTLGPSAQEDPHPIFPPALKTFHAWDAPSFCLHCPHFPSLPGSDAMYILGDHSLVASRKKGSFTMPWRRPCMALINVCSPLE